MLGTEIIDGNNAIDWGKTREDYAKFRPGPPESFYHKLKALDVGIPGQKVLDLGTGTGVLARKFARQGCEVVATDISSEQIEMAKYLSIREGLNIAFHCCPSEALQFYADSFDVITANQCFLYFDNKKVIPLIKKFLKKDGVFVTSHFSWMPFLDEVAMMSEKLILKHNSNWTSHSYKGDIPPIHGGLESDFKLKSFFYYDEPIPFTHESWRGRIRACRGIGATLNKEEVIAFDLEHEKKLKNIVEENFSVIHRIDAHIMVPIERI